MQSLVKAYFVAQAGDTREGIFIGRKAMSSLLGDIRDGKVEKGDVALAEIQQAMGFDGSDIDFVCKGGSLSVKAQMAINTIHAAEIRFGFDGNGHLISGNKCSPLDPRGQARAVYQRAEECELV